METEKKRRLRFYLKLVAGMALGFLYWRNIGCLNGQCPITSSPFMSVIWGGLLGGLGFGLFEGSPTDKSHREWYFLGFMSFVYFDDFQGEKNSWMLWRKVAWCFFDVKRMKCPKKCCVWLFLRHFIMLLSLGQEKNNKDCRYSFCCKKNGRKRGRSQGKRAVGRCGDFYEKRWFLREDIGCDVFKAWYKKGKKAFKLLFPSFFEIFACYFFSQRSSQLKNVRCQSTPFCGLSTQWFSSGKMSSSAGMPRRRAALKALMPCVALMR